jgi:hypothetical protein
MTVFRVFEDLLALDPKAEPDLRYMENLGYLNSMVHSLQTYFRSVIVRDLSFDCHFPDLCYQAPLTVAQPTVHRELMINKNSLTMALETKINAVLAKQMDGKGHPLIWRFDTSFIVQ